MSKPKHTGYKWTDKITNTERGCSIEPQENGTYIISFMHNDAVTQILVSLQALKTLKFCIEDILD